MFKRNYTPGELTLFKEMDDRRRAFACRHEAVHLEFCAREALDKGKFDLHDYMLAQIAAIEAIHDAVLISRADFERLCANHAAPPVPVAGEMLFNK